MKPTRSAIRRRWVNLRYSSGVPAAVDRRTARRSLSRFPRPAGGGYHLLLAPPGSGNIGDQALFEAFLENTSGEILVIVRELDDVRVPDPLRDRVRLVALPGLVYAEGAAHRDAVDRYVGLCVGASSVSVIGADIMDGRYSLRGSVRRASLAEIAARVGAPTRIIGFSWASSPRGGARRALARASHAGVRMLLRDPRSAERAIGDGIRDVRLVADVVFAATSRDRAPLAPPSPYAIVNVSGLIGRGVDQTGEYRRIVEHLRAAGLHVVILPHVIKDLSDDLVACTALADAVGPDGVTLVETLLTPGQVRDLAAGATATVTGRMHLSIMSLMGGTPAVTLATQGKVEGLMEFFGIPELCVSPTGEFGAAVVSTLDRVVPDDSIARAAIAAGLERVTELARRNTADLGVLDAVAGSTAELRERAA